MADYVSSQADAAAPESQLATGTVTVPFTWTPSANTSGESNISMVKLPKGATITAIEFGIRGTNIPSFTLKPQVFQTVGDASDVLTDTGTDLCSPEVVAGPFVVRAKTDSVLPYEIPLPSDKSGSIVKDDARLSFAGNNHPITTATTVCGSVTYTFQRRDLGVDHSASDF